MDKNAINKTTLALKEYKRRLSMTVGSVNMMVYDILSYCQKLDPGAQLTLGDLDSQVILQTISTELPNYVHSKNLEHFYDNTVWYFGTDGDIRAVLFDSFQEALDLLKQKQPKTVKEAIGILEGYIATHKEIEIINSEQEDNSEAENATEIDIAEDLTAITNYTAKIGASSASNTKDSIVIDVLSWIIAIILFTLSGFAITQGILFLPIFCSTLGVLAIAIALIIRIRWSRNG